MPRVVETMDAHLDRTIALHVIHLQRAWNEFAGRFATDVLLDAVGQCGLAEGDATLIDRNGRKGRKDLRMTGNLE